MSQSAGFRRRGDVLLRALASKGIKGQYPPNQQQEITLKNFDFWNSWGGLTVIGLILVLIIMNGILGTGAWDNMPY